MADDDDSAPSVGKGHSPADIHAESEHSMANTGTSCGDATTGSRNSHCGTSTEDSLANGAGGDAWAVDDWATTSNCSRSSSASPCTGVKGIGIPQREIADAVLIELQLDLQNQVQRAVNEMSSWISEEITFARQGFQEDAAKANAELKGTWEKEHTEIQKSHNELTSKVDHLQKTLEEQVAGMAKLRDESSHRASCQTEPVPAGNVKVMEARMVGEERRWRLKIDEIQEGLSKQLQRINVLDSQSSNVARKVTAHEAALDKSGSSMRDLESRLSKIEAEENTAKESLERRLRRTECLANSVGDVVEQVAALSTTSKDTASKVRNMEDKIASNDSRRQEEFNRLATGDSRRRDELNEICKTLGKHLTRIDMFDEQCTQLADKIARHDHSIGKATGEVQNLGERLAAGDSRRQEELNRIAACDNRRQEELNEVRKTLGKHLPRFDRLDEQCTYLAERIASHDNAIGKNTGAVQSLQETVMAGESRRQEELNRMAACDNRRQEELNEVRKTLGTHLPRFDMMDQQCKHLAERVSSVDSAIGRNTGAIHSLEEKVAADEMHRKGEIADLRQSIGKQQPRIDIIDDKCSQLAQQLATQDSAMEKHFKDSQSLEQRLIARDGQTQEELKVVQQCLSSIEDNYGHLERRVAEHDGEIEKNVKMLQAAELRFCTDIDKSTRRLDVMAQDAEDIGSRVVALDARIKRNDGQLDDVEVQLRKTIEERLTESQAICKQVDRHEVLLDSFPKECRARVKKLEESFAKALAGVSDDCRRVHSDFSARLNHMPSASDLQDNRVAVQTWVDNARKSHQAAIQGLDTALKQMAGKVHEQDAELQKHQDYMKELSAWLNEGLTRDEAISEVILHIIEEDYPDLMPAFEKRLQGTVRHAS
jgi:chromosome segregation ATPase